MFNKNSKVNYFTLLKLISLVVLTLLVGCTKVETPPSIPHVDSTSQDVTVPPTDEASSSSSPVEVHFIDTGNSDSILIKEGQKAMLIDGADNDDEKSLVDYIKTQGVTEFEYVVATHPHADHIGALDSVIESFPINYLFVANGDADTKTYRDFINAAMDKKLTPSVPLEGQKFMLENSYFEVFNTNGGSNTNDQSLVLLFTNGEDKMLFTGDAEEDTEVEILSQMVEVDILKVGHHGSHSSTSPAFLEKVNPKYAVITVGKDNKYGHPHVETVDKLKKAAIEVHRTDECGDVIFISTGNGVSTDCEPGSYNRGGSSTSNTNKPSNSKPSSTDTPSPVPTPAQPEPIVYWTPNGKSYHATDKCSALAKSKTILSGTLEESGKNDPCDRCYS